MTIEDSLQEAAMEAALGRRRSGLVKGDGRFIDGVTRLRLRRKLTFKGCNDSF